MILVFLKLLSGVNKKQSVFHWQFLITYIFPVSLKSGACFITGHWGKFWVKNTILCLHIIFWHFFLFCFSSKVFFLIFISFLDKVSNFRNRILTNQKPELVIWNYHSQCMIISIYHGLTLSYKENFLNFEPIQINNSRRGASKVRGLEENR